MKPGKKLLCVLTAVALIPLVAAIIFLQPNTLLAVTLLSEYTVIGDEVNLASRIETYTLRGQILISQKTFSRVKDLVIVEKPIYVSVKGRREPTPL